MPICRGWLRALGLAAVVLLHLNRGSQQEEHEEVSLATPPTAPPIELRWLHWEDEPEDELYEPADPTSPPTSPPPPLTPLTPLPLGALLDDRWKILAGCTWRRLPRHGLHGYGGLELNRSAVMRFRLAGEFECASLCARLEECRAYSFRARGEHPNFGRCFVLSRAGRGRADGDIFDSAFCDRRLTPGANSSQPSSTSDQTPIPSVRASARPRVVH